MSRTPFLQQVAQHYYTVLGGDISRKTFVFPSRRAAQFFRHYLALEAETPIFSPQCLTINDFLTSLLPERRTLDRTALLFELYRCYQDVRAGRETERFDDFIYWGDIILKDFDLVDRHLVSARELYTNISDFKEMQDDFSYMDEQTRDILSGFWKSFQGQAQRAEPSPSASPSSRERFLDFWLSLYPLYQHFNARLLERDYAYEGGLYRAIAEEAPELVDRLAEDTSLIFVGLFDITPSEFRIFRALRSRGYAEFCWDEAVHILTDEQHRARRMMLKNKELLGGVRGAWSVVGRTLPTEVEVISCASTVSQVKALPQVLVSLGVDLSGETSDEDLTTAIILPHDSLLLPTVGSIPSAYEHLNITLGYPLSRTPIAIMIARWAELLGGDQRSYRSDELIALLSLQILVERFPSLGALSERISGQRNFRLSTTWLHDEYHKLREASGSEAFAHEPLLEGYEHILDLLLPRSADALGFLSALRVLLTSIFESSCLEHASHEAELEAETPTDGEDTRPVLSIFDAEFIHHYLLLVNRLYGLVQEYALEAMSLAAIARLLEGLSQGFTIPFEGNPLQGLQIMGLLESRTLHFRHLVYLSAQEGLMPADKHASTLIPHALRVGYRLPTAEWQEVAESYRFYQSISGVERLVMLCGKEDSTGGKGEESRYILQLEYLYDVPVSRRTAQAMPRVSPPSPIVIDKDTPEIAARLARYFSDGEDRKALSASRLSTYISCPLRFYYEAVLEIYEDQLPQELIAANDFGSILHRTIEQLYAPYVGGRRVPKRDLERLLAEGNTQIGRAVRSSYEQQYRRPAEGALDRLHCSMIETYIRSIVRYDLVSADEFAYLDSEGRFEGTLSLSDGRAVNFKGDIDRIDILYPEGCEATPRLRLLDYKTGSDQNKPIEDWSSLTSSKKTKACMQILLYCELALSGEAQKASPPSAIERAYPITPAVMLVRQMAQSPEGYSPYLKVKGEDKTTEQLDDYRAHRDSFLEVMRALLDSIFDPAVPFTQTEDQTACQYCPFALSCGR